MNLRTAVSVSVLAAAGSGLRDPGIPAGERIVYSVTVGDDRMTMTETTAHDSAAPGYRITSLCPTDDKVVTLRRPGMTATGYRHTWRNGGTVIARAHALEREGAAYAEDGIPAIHYHCLPYMLRGYPFGARDRMDILMMGGDTPMKLYVEYGGTETVETGAGPVECHKIKMGMPGFLGSVVPKTHYWYSAAAPHYLVKYEGSSGPPGSPKKTVLLQSYSKSGGK